MKAELKRRLRKTYGQIYKYSLRTCFASKILAAIIINLKDSLTKLGGVVIKASVSHKA